MKPSKLKQTSQAAFAASSFSGGFSKKCIFWAEKCIFLKKFILYKNVQWPKIQFSVCQKYFFAVSKNLLFFTILNLLMFYNLKTWSQLISITEECSKLSVCFQYFHENFLPKHDFGILMNEKSFLLPVQWMKNSNSSLPPRFCIIEFVHHELVLLEQIFSYQHVATRTHSYNIPLKSKGQSTTLIYWTLWPKTRLTAWLKFSYVGAEIESGSSLIKTKKRRFHVTWHWLGCFPRDSRRICCVTNPITIQVSYLQSDPASLCVTLHWQAEMKNWSHSSFVTYDCKL